MPRNEMQNETARDMSLEMEGTAAPTDLSTCLDGLVNAMARGMARIVAPRGLAHFDFAVLRLFLGVEEWTTPCWAQALPLAPSGISRTVTKLVEKGLVRRRRLLSDRRVVILTLTDAGTALAQGLNKRVGAYDASLCEGAGEEEMATFVAVSSKVMANYAALAKAVRS